MCNAYGKDQSQKKTNVKIITYDLEFINDVRELNGLGRIKRREDGSYVVVGKRGT